MRILLAEDNDVNRMLVSRVLAQSWHHVDEAGDGREAVHAAMRADYDVILMDMQMPVMDGMEATKAIRSLPGPAASVPIIALTADAMPDHRQTYLDAGIDELLTKPIDWGLLNRTLRRVRGGLGSRRKVESSAPAMVLSFDTLPLFDRGRVDAGLGVLPPDRVAGMLAMLPSEMNRRVDDYRSALGLGDLEGARRSAHALKGMAANFGALRLESVARAAEAASASRASAELVAPLMADVVERTAVAALDLGAIFRARG